MGYSVEPYTTKVWVEPEHMPRLVRGKTAYALIYLFVMCYLYWNLRVILETEKANPKETKHVIFFIYNIDKYISHFFEKDISNS